MTQHSAELTIERTVPASEAAPGLSEKIAEYERRAAPAPKRHVRKTLLAAASAIALAGAGYFGWEYWTIGRFLVSTDDAYVQADNTTIAPKVSGYIAEVLIGDNEPVKAGQVLARIDDRDYEVALEQAKADVAAAEAAIATKQASLDAQQSVVEGSRAAVAVDEANLTFAGQEDKRYATLASTGYGSAQNAQQAASRLAAARASVARDKAALDTAIRQMSVLKAELAEAQATRAHDEALEGQAKLNLSYATIVAPIEGVVGARTLRVGQYVQAGTQLMAVVPVSTAYVVANYKETQLADVRPGEPVEIEVDTFPGHKFHGRVDSIAPASGQEFALLPPDNATGNFTKVVQRIPVKITLDPGSAFADMLRPGMSVYPTVDTRAQALQSASAAASKS
jgi:membrane fusion protein (multidrug efflux system)